MDRADLTTFGHMNVCKLPCELYFKIRDHLDVNSGWRVFVGVLKNYNLANVERIGRGSSPTEQLIHDLSVAGKTINDFVKYAAMVEDYYILSLFNVYIPAQITEQPAEEMHVLEGENVTLTVKATGCPQPRFQWYRNEHVLEGEAHNTLYLDSRSHNIAGEYCCLVYNDDDQAHYVQIKPVTVRVLPAPEIEVKEHPKFCTISKGGTAIFKCEVWGETDVHYQWFQDENELHDEPNVVKGSNTNEIRLYNITSNRWLGCYSCLVTRGGKETMTKGAALQFLDVVPGNVDFCTATDKVALLIGNYDYRGDNSLRAPKFDVQTLSTIFQSLNFKVVSLLNLTKQEMLSAVYEFTKLVGEGVYCVFYFCGHGFEVGGQCFLVPTDAPTGYTYEPCVSADHIFRSLLKQKPQICCMILDICRKWKEERARPGILEQDVVERGNAIVCYGTSYGLAAYESRNYGILVSHLKNILALPVDIETVFKELRSAISKDPKVNGTSSNNACMQIPEIRTNLLEVNRSFKDQIVYRGHTADFNMRQLLWEEAHRKPDPIINKFEFPDFCVLVRLEFQQDFSNVLKIYTSVIDPGPTQTCIAFVSAIPTDFAEKAKVLTISHSRGSKLCKNYVVINNIQRLKSSMKIKLTVRCQGPDVERTEQVELGLPLVAKLELWKERQEPNYQRRPEEVEEDPELKDYVQDFQKISCR